MSIGFPDFGGIASVNAPSNVFNEVNAFCDAGQAVVIGPFNVSGQSYSIKFDPHESSAGTLPFPEIRVQVTDPANFVVDDVLYEMVMSATDGDCEFLLKGPLNGSSITVTVSNNDTVSMFFNLSVNFNSGPLLVHTCTTTSYNGVGAGLVIAPNSSPKKGLLGTNYRTALAAAGSDLYVIPPAPGPITIGVRAVTAADPIACEIAPYVNNNSYAGVGGGVLSRVQTDANGNAVLVCNMIRSAAQLVFINKGSAATDYVWTAAFDVTSG
jgi:hypothetical protein